MAAVPTMQPARPELPQLRKRPDDAHHSGFGPSPEAGGFISISVDNSERAGRESRPSTLAVARLGRLTCVNRLWGARRAGPVPGAERVQV